MKPRIDSEESERLYLEGRRCLRGRTREQLQKSLDCFRRACDLDPCSARPFSGLADAYTLLYTYHLMPLELACPNAKQAANRALELDDGLAEAHASAGQVRVIFDKDWDGAQRELDVALQLDPDCVSARHWHAGLLARTGRLSEALNEVEHALELDPTHTVLLTSGALLNARLGRWDEALGEFDKALVIDPTNEAIRINLALVLTQIGETDRALEVIRSAQELAPRSLFVRGVHATILYYSRQYDLTIEQMEEAAELVSHLPPMAHVILGLAYLQKESYQRAFSQFDLASQHTGEYTDETDLAQVAACLRAITQAKMGDSDYAREELRRIESQPSEKDQEPCWLGLLCFAVGKIDDGFKWLEKAQRTGDMWVRYLKVHPLFDPVRSEPRFTALLENMGLREDAHPPAKA
ncbi:MAG: tetratricopeptide repeat protein [Bradymonadales bacterium]|nr:tetratricopeptide repeat protein [Bradymonadales bacterium]